MADLIPLRAGVLDLAQGRLVRSDGLVALSDLERRALERLVAIPGAVVARDTLRVEVWGQAPTSQSRAVDTTMRRLRAKIEVDPDQPDHLLTAHGDGYRFVPLAPRAPAPAPVSAAPALRLDAGLVELTRGQFQRPDGTTVLLSAQELRILQILHEAGGAPVERRALARQALGTGFAAEGALTSAIRRLRERIERDPDDPQSLLTHRGVGYRLEVRPPAPAPRRLSTFVGRAAERARASALLASARLVTLVGPAGAGKTRLAEELVAERPPLAWCALAAARDREGLRQLLAAALQVSPEDPAALGRRLAGAQTLVVLDNAEHLAEEIARIAQPWLLAHPSLVLLVTSQRRLGLDAERVVEVGPLAEDDAVHLFVTRAWTERGRAVPPDTDAVRALVQHLDHLPLAIELAAARVGVLGPEGLLRRLDQRLDLLAAPGSEPRHASLRAALEGSVGLLDAPTRAALAAAAVFRGSFDLAAAEAVLGPRALEALETLAERSLLKILPGGRFELYESVAARASELLVDPEPAQAHQRHYAALARRWFEEGRGTELSSSANEVLAELGNLLAAVSREGPPAHQACLTLFLSGLLRRRGEQVTSLSLLDRALAAPLDAELRARLLAERAMTRLTMPRTAGCQQDAEAALVLGGPDVAVLAWTALGLLAVREGRADAAWAPLQAALDASDALPDGAPRATELRVAARNHLGIAARRRGDLTLALTLYRRALAACAPGPTRGILMLNVAIVLDEREETEAAAAHAAAAVAELQGSLYVAQLSQAIVVLAGCHWRRGELDQAEARLDQALPLARAGGSAVDLAYTQVARLGLAVEAGRIPTARARLHEALAQTAPDLHPARLPLRLYEAALHLEAGQTEAATAALEAAQTHARTPAGQALIATYQALIAGTLSPRRADPRPEERVAVAVARRLRGD